MNKAPPRSLRWFARAAALGTAVALLLWLVAVPSFPGAHPPGIHPDESAARATLIALHDAQRRFRAERAADRDGDGRGEFGWFSELTAHEPPLLPPAFRLVTDGRVERGAYVFQVWLPAAEDRWVTEGSATPVHAGAAAERWCAYAWPREPSPARRVFHIDADGAVYARSNRHGRYAGHARPVPIDAALPTSIAGALPTSAARVGRDGALWTASR